MIEPTLEEFCSTSVNVSQPYGFQSEMTARGDLDLAVLAVEAVGGAHDAFLERGRGHDDLERRARLEGIGDGAVAPLRRRSPCANAFGLNVGRMARARISPVRGSIMTAIAALERVRRQAASTSFSARYWSVASMVSAMPWPGTDGLEHGRARP